MSDPLDLVTLGTHGGTAAGTGLLVTWVSRFFASKEQQQIATQLALLAQKLDSLSVSVDKHADLGERVGMVEASAKRSHERLDKIEDRLEEPRRRR